MTGQRCAHVPLLLTRYVARFEQYLVRAKHVVVDAPEVLDGLETVHDLDAALIRLAGVPALLLRALAVVPETVPILARPQTTGASKGDKIVQQEHCCC